MDSLQPLDSYNELKKPPKSNSCEKRNQKPSKVWSSKFENPSRRFKKEQELRKLVEKNEETNQTSKENLSTKEKASKKSTIQATRV